MTRVRAALVGASLVVIGGIAAAVLVLPRPAQAQGQSTVILISGTCDCQESSFGDFVADALRAEANADIALVGAITFRSGSLAPGGITLERVSPLLTNPREVWDVSRLTGVQVRQALEHAVRSAPLPSNSFLQVSGVEFSYNPEAARDQRVQSVRVGEEALAPEKAYRVVMPRSLAKGGSGFFKIFGEPNVTTRGDRALGQTVVDYAARVGTISNSGVGRITAQQ